MGNHGGELGGGDAAAAARPGLTVALSELASLLSCALGSCSGSEQESQSSPLVQKLRRVLLHLLSSCQTSSSGMLPHTSACMQAVLGKSVCDAGLAWRPPCASNAALWPRTGKHIVAVLRVQTLVAEQLAVTFADGAHRQAMRCLVHLLSAAPRHKGCALRCAELGCAALK